ncbi:hypothetical protein DFH09DRAFT_1375750 [Mycena vulgaris]|nr:hypothetical protein DFH09DRAFT_1375750 [Mycena vulgaris]
MSSITDPLVLLHRDDVPRTVGFTLYGMYLVFFAVYLRAVMRRPMETRVSQVLLAPMILLFLSSTTQFAFDMIMIVSLGRIGSDLVKIFSGDIFHKYEVIDILGQWTVVTNFLICDLMVIWRAFVMYSHRRAVQIGLWIVAAVDIGALCMWHLHPLRSRPWYSALHLSGFKTHEILFNYGQLSTIGRRLSKAVAFISLGATLVGTGTIVVASWRQRRLSNHRFREKGHGDVSPILFLAVETGALWAVIQLLFSILTAIAPGEVTSVDVAEGLINRFALYMAAILATVTVLITGSQRRMLIEDPLKFGTVSESMRVLEDGDAPAVSELDHQRRGEQGTQQDLSLGVPRHVRQDTGEDMQALFNISSGANGSIAQQLRDMAERAALLLEARTKAPTIFVYKRFYTVITVFLFV